LCQRAEALGLRIGHQVLFAGRVEGAQKDDLLRRAQYVVMPSRYEAWPLVAVEAFCYRLPVVLFEIPELQELPDEVCAKVRPFKVQELGRVMADLAQDSDRRQRMGEAAKRYARRFDWDDLAKEYEAFFASMV
jgi:glycosyltransferase involved in cell wall biosynthesis